MIILNNSNILFFDINQFQANANTIYPAGTIIYYVLPGGVISGVYKLADGISTLSSLKVMVSDYDIFRGLRHADASDYIVDIGRWTTGRYIKSTLLSLVPYTNVTAPSSVWNLILIDIPVYVYSLSINVNSFTSPGVVSLAIYSVDSNTLNGSLVTGSDGSINITSTGRKTLSYSIPVLLQPGGYYLYLSASTNTFSRLCLSSNYYKGIYNNSGNYVRIGTSAAYAYPPATIGPLSSASGLKVYFEMEYLPAI